ncbi:PIN domain-containing protein [Flavobacterium azooxidireducens]|uniref:PIN domain-containing protein n=1 Tax=Flavobacterium azooxidireducens TaxID=1871076 RepID=A0ABY4KG55_9FLAO|nr:PIN domain-containing protein [Flavobacterium azooxidireducens]UPQ78698.1 PIN domain-containing protein [Flavobacterium azooxidireducens]
MTEKNIPKSDSLIFIDTNIYLDFYRIRKSNVSMKYLEEIVKHKNLIITSSQVEMEYKKNRQSAILESITEINKISVNLNVPTIFSNDEAVEKMKKSKKEIDELQKKLKTLIEEVLKNPNIKDPVYKSLENIFTNKSPINLDRKNEIRFKIRELANKRFNLGYPPRKKDDNSIGDAVNWEWIIKCAEENKKNIILVTRDTDFGVIYDNESYINDWLRQEFIQRIGKKQTIFLTDKLSKAFQLVQIPVTEEMIEEEEKVIKFSNNLSIYDTVRAMGKASENLKMINESREFSMRIQRAMEYMNNIKNIK